jgi:hypothetical protein
LGIGLTEFLSHAVPRARPRARFEGGGWGGDMGEANENWAFAFGESRSVG